MPFSCGLVPISANHRKYSSARAVQRYTTRRQCFRKVITDLTAMNYESTNLERSNTFLFINPADFINLSVIFQRITIFQQTMRLFIKQHIYFLSTNLNIQEILLKIEMRLMAVFETTFPLTGETLLQTNSITERFADRAMLNNAL